MRTDGTTDGTDDGADDWAGERFRARVDPRPDDTVWPPMTWPVPAGTVLGDDVVRLERLDPDRDADALHRVLDDDRVWAHLAGRPVDAHDLAEVLRHRQDVLGWHQWLVLDAGPAGEGYGRVLGTTSYLEVSPADARLEVGSTAYAPDVWGTAVNPATKLLVLGFAFDELSVGRVQLKTDVRNTRSQQAIARLGARFEGVLRRYQRRSDGTVRDTVVFSVTAEQWPQVRDGLRARLGRARRAAGAPGPAGPLTG